MVRQSRSLKVVCSLSGGRYRRRPPRRGRLAGRLLALSAALLLAGQALAETTQTYLFSPTGEMVDSIPLVGFDFQGSGKAHIYDGADGADGRDCTKTRNGDTTEGGHGQAGKTASVSTGTVTGNYVGSLVAVTANGGSGGDGGSNMVANQGSSYYKDYPGVEPGSQCEQGSKRGRDAGDGARAADVSLTVNSGNVSTASTAIIAQSVGGDGGKGGDSYKNKNANYAKTGDGGRAAAGARVNVTNHANLAVQGETETWQEWTATLDDTGALVELILNEIIVNNAHGIVVQTGGGIGGEGGQNPTSNGKPGGSGGIAANGGAANVYNYGSITTTGGSGIIVQNVGGMGGDAGLNKKGKGGAGGNGGDGGAAGYYNGGAVINQGRLTIGCGQGQAGLCDILGAYGIYVQSVGGGGGNAGAAGGSKAIGADGGAAGYGYRVYVDNTGDIAVHTQSSVGVFAQSVGGGGGSGGMAHARGANALAIGGSGGDGGEGGVVDVRNRGNICTGGACVPLAELTENTAAAGGAAGIIAQSIGGGGGHGGSAKAKSTGSFWGLVGGSAVAIGGSGGAGGHGQGVTVANSGSIFTAELNAAGIVAQSIGGGGGHGGGAVAFDLSLLGGGSSVALGGSGGGGGAGRRVSVNCTAYGGVASNAKACGDIAWTVTTPSQTLWQEYAPVRLDRNDNNQNVIATAGLGSSGVVAQSIGGGGGTGGYAVAVGASLGLLDAPTVSFAHGGEGGSGGKGGHVFAGTNGMSTYTQGDFATGVLAQSIGGGGGSGGYAVSLAADLLSVAPTVSLAMGGSGGNGGPAGEVMVDNPGGLIATEGDFSHGIQAQSIAGGGGAGGVAVAASGTLLGSSVAVAVGGTGRSGGESGEVRVYNRSGQALGMSGVGAADIVTQGYGASAIVAQSVGGGGGSGGAGIAASVSLTQAALSVGAGGAGGAGNRAGNVQVDNSGNLTTVGGGAAAILAQSVGGAGGSGGVAASANLVLTANASLAVGGNGAAAGTAGQVKVSNQGTIVVTADNAPEVYVPQVPDSSLNQALAAWVALGGDEVEASPAVKMLYSLLTGQANPRLAATQTNAPGILAQSIGGAGGAGGFAAAAGVSGAYGASVAVGGDGGSGGNANQVDVSNTGALILQGAQSPAIAAMSIGGNGGFGGFAASTAVSLRSVAASIGGQGGSGGRGGDVHVSTRNSNLSQPIMTQGNQSAALLGMSVGGNGGVGGFDTAVAVNLLDSLALGIGGAGGNGGRAGAVRIDNAQYLTTTGLLSPGVLAMSVGGQGGMGGISSSVAQSWVRDMGATVGGAGGGGGQAGNVAVASQAPIVTYGNLSSGIVAHSIGGSGGMGGLALSSTVTTDLIPNSRLKLSVGGAGGGTGGSGGRAGSVGVENDGLIQTYGFLSHAITAQSIGGSGGTGGMAIDGSFDITSNIIPFVGPDDSRLNMGVSVGGEGGTGGDGNTVSVRHDGTLVTGYGVVEAGQPGGAFMSSGVLAQSIGGAGGAGGSALALAAGNTSHRAAVSVGGIGGAGGNAGDVVVAGNITCNLQAGCQQGITTLGAGSAAIRAQAIGGGGGSGGASVSLASAFPLSAGAVGVGGAGGNGGAGGRGGRVEVNVGGSLTTFGVLAPGIQAQSIGGGGGDGGASLSGNFQPDGWVAEEILKQTLSLFGVNGSDTSGAFDGAVDKVYAAARAVTDVYADQVGTDFPASISGSASVAVGGAGGNGGNADAVVVNSTARVVTGAAGRGYHAAGIMAQAIGGGGGSGGFASTGQQGSVTGAVQLGGLGGQGGHGGAVTVNAANLVMTAGAQSSAVVAQSIGGGGGAAGQVFERGTAIGSFAIGVGGTGGQGGDGRAVAVANSAVLLTDGMGATGIAAQSIGGGGGSGGATLLGGLGDAVQDQLPGPVSATAMALTGGSFDLGGVLEAGAQVGLYGGNRAGQAGADAGVSYSHSVGGSGGIGGLGGSVRVTNGGNIFTGATLDENGEIVSSGAPLRTAHAAAILAQSIGGGGGSNLSGAVDANPVGKSSTAQSLGGSGDGNNTAPQSAGAVTVANTGLLVTYGVNAAGIQAQSIGGGGGASGTSSALTRRGEGLAGAHANALQLGGSMRGAGGEVQVCDTLGSSDDCQRSASAQAILTHGAASHGVVAQSIGGGGGSAVALDSALQEAVSDQLASGDFTLALDGRSIAAAASRGVVTGVHLGGTAGDGGERQGAGVEVMTAADIGTEGTGALGVLAQSVGGGGGLAASHSVNASSGDHRVQGLLGANMAGPLATGGNIAAQFAGAVATGGDLAHGVLVQSVGGGGGLFQASSHTVGIGGEAMLDLALGAMGGANNAANNGAGIVTAVLNGAVQTRGDSAVGVLAQSVGAGGGVAASHTSTASSGNVTARMALGSAGVNGGSNRVTLDYGRAMVVTEGRNALAVLAQSVGGGGGLAMVSHEQTLAGSVLPSGDIQADFELGFRHAGRASSSGSTVAVSSDANTLWTLGDNAAGLVMQSVAGGGTALFAGSAAAAGSDTQLAFQLGGVGTGGRGSAVDAMLGVAGESSVIATEGRNAFGLVAQSIGGGGGLAAFALEEREGGVTHGRLAGGEGWLGMSRLAVNTGHTGGNVGLTLNDHQISTTGLNAAGLVAQSIGGGGGIAAAAVSEGSIFDGTLHLGAASGIDCGSSNCYLGEAGSVSVALRGSRIGGDAPAGLIVTEAAMAPALLAQSISVGGGLGAMQITDLVLGAGAGGRAGAVTVDNDATLVTWGDSALGLVAQSIGGGGGLGFATGDVTLGGALSSANGAAVIVNQHGDVVTYGDRAHGILAQSVGGGGGAALSRAQALGTTVEKGTGHGGGVNVNVSGIINTYGDAAHGVVAQSAAGGGGLVQNGDALQAVYGGGGGNAGAVRVEVSGHVQVHGTGAHGIFATANTPEQVEIIDAAGSPPLLMTLAADDTTGHHQPVDVVIREGATVTGGVAGSAVMFDASRSELRNHGTLLSQDGALGQVIQSRAGNTRIVNERGGTLVGAIHLFEHGSNRLHNMAGATLLAGADIRLGEGNVLHNDGYLGLASAVIGSATLTGDLIQGESGSLALRFDQRTGAADSLHVTGAARLQGVIRPLLVDAGHIQPGSRTTRVFSADGELDIDGLRVLDSALLSHALSVDADGLTVTTTADFTPAGLRGDGQRLGSALAGLQRHGGTRLSQGITAVLAQLPDVQALNLAYDTVASGGVSAVPMMSLQNASLVMDTVTARLDDWRADGLGSSTRLQPLTAQADAGLAPQGWLSVAGNSSDGAGLRRDVHALVLGADVALDERTLVGASLSGSRLAFDLDRPDARGRGDEVGVSLYGLHRFGNAYASGVLFAAANRLDYRSSLRRFGHNLTGETEFDNRTVGGRLEAGYTFTLPGQRSTVTPFVAMQPAQVHQDSAREVYNDALGIGVNFRSAVIESLPADIGLQWGTYRALASGARLTSFARLTWRHDFRAEREIQRDFHSIRLRDSSLPAAENTALARVGMQYGVGRALSISAELEGQWSSPYDTFGGSVGLVYRW